MDLFKNLLSGDCIIPSVTSVEELNFFLKHTQHPWVCLKMGDINSLVSIISTIHKHDRKVMLHLDSVKGINKDKEGIRWLKRIGTDAVITMKSQHIKMIRDQNLYAILGSFIVDSASVNQTVQNIRTNKPDAVLIMPMSIPHSIYETLQAEHTCILAGGLGTEHSIIQQSLDCGSCACVVTDRKRITEEYL